jgi:rare lipoprotein A
VFYKDDGPPAVVPAELDRIADAVPRDEPLHRFANRPYTVFSVNYTPLTLHAPLVQRGIASWYGRKFHGQKTAIGETYDMFAMTAAHPTAPLPSFARVTHLANGRSVVVRVNDRGPFLAGRIVDLSYAAAHRVGIAQAGSGEVMFELLLPPDFKSTTRDMTVAAPTATTINPPTAFGAAASSSATSVPAAAGDGNRYFVQLGAFGNFGNAEAFQARVKGELNDLTVVRQVGGLFRVQLGPYSSLDAAQVAMRNAQAKLGATLLIVTERAAP